MGMPLFGADDVSVNVQSRTGAGRLLAMARALRGCVTLEDIPAGSVLVREGETTDCLYLLRDGEVQVRLGAGPTARTVARLGRGACIGETALLTGAVSSTTVRAESDVRAYRIGQQAFLAAAEAEPSIFRELARELAKRLRSADSVIKQEPGQRVVGLWHEPAHTAPARDIVLACARWSEGTLLAIDLHAASNARRSVRDYVHDGASYSALATELVMTRSVAISGGDATAEDVALFLRTAAEFASLVVVSGSGFSAGHALDLSEIHVLTDGGPVRRDQDYNTDVAEVLVGDGFDAERVARRICEREIGLALGGGGARGFAHIGVLRALKERGVPFDYVTGTSIGAAVAAGLASGMAIDAISASIERTGRVALLPSLPPLHSMFNPAFIEGELRRQFGAAQIEDFETGLGLLATDLSSGDEVLFTSGPVVPAVMASAAIPGIFPPVRYDGSLLVDGALRSPVPVRACRKIGADVVIASQMRVAQSASAARRRPMPWAPETILLALDVMQEHITAENIETADLTIVTTLPSEQAGLFDFAHRASIEAAGEQAAHEALARNTQYAARLSEAA